MLHHVSVGVRDVERAVRFYDSTLAALGYKRVMEFLPYAVAYGELAPEFWVQLPADHNPASVGNGVHIGFVARSKDAVAAFHSAALAAGGADEGGPGPRPDYGPDYYGAFVRDPDGNKLEAVLLRGPVAAAAKKQPKKKAKKKTKKKAKGSKKSKAEKGKAKKAKKGKGKKK
jgi:catechol 2,3-dioxygenase-like lactoylglutathione lyase family enzyme